MQPNRPTTPAAPDTAFIDQVRASARQVVRELGFMRPTLAGTRYSPSAVHALLETHARGRTTAGELAALLRLDKSSVSRLLRRLVEAGELTETASGEDGRAKWLALSKQGRRTCAAIETHARGQVSAALARLDLPRRRDVAAGLAHYAAALAPAPTGDDVAAVLEAPRDIRVARGWRAGAIGRIAEMHGRYYARHGFGRFFEAKVANGLADFAGRLGHPGNGLWLALEGERIVGSVAIDGQDLEPGQAHLRWFILDEGCRGTGVGRRLLRQALRFCDRQGFDAVQLWTVQGLNAARHLYEAHGFTLAQQWQGTQWGRTLTEQRFVRPRPASAD